MTHVNRRSARRRRCQGDPLEPRRNRSIWRAELWREGLCRSLIVAEQAASALASLGVRRGSEVAALLPNSAEILDDMLLADIAGRQHASGREFDGWAKDAFK